MTSALYLDRSPGLLLAVCTECRPCWRAAADDTADGWRRLVAHAATCHRGNIPDTKAVRNARRLGERARQLSHP